MIQSFLQQLTKLCGLLILLFSVFSCNHLSDTSSSSDIIDTLALKYAKGFRIMQTDEGYMAEIFNPWQQAQNVTLRYYLNRQSTSDASSVPKIHIPVKKIVCLSSTHIAFVEALNETSTICGVSGINNVYNSTILRKWKHDSIFEAGYENNLNYEKIIKTSPDVVFAYGIGSEINGYVGKLQELGIPVILIGEYLEQHPLARTEWIKFFAAFFDKLNEAERIFAQTDSLYQYWKNKATQYSYHPTVMTGLPWNGSWYISGAQTYAAQLINDAGGQYLWYDQLNNISVPMDFERVFERCRQADYWLNIGQATTKNDILNIDRRLALFRPYKVGTLYNNIARMRPQGGNDYWESGTANPHLILADMVKILHSEDFSKDTLYYYKKIH